MDFLELFLFLKKKYLKSDNLALSSVLTITVSTHLSTCFSHQPNLLSHFLSYPLVMDLNLLFVATFIFWPTFVLQERQRDKELRQYFDFEAIS